MAVWSGDTKNGPWDPRAVGFGRRCGKLPVLRSHAPPPPPREGGGVGVVVIPAEVGGRQRHGRKL